MHLTSSVHLALHALNVLTCFGVLLVCFSACRLKYSAFAQERSNARFRRRPYESHVLPVPPRRRSARLSEFAPKNDSVVEAVIRPERSFADPSTRKKCGLMQSKGPTTSQIQAAVKVEEPARAVKTEEPPPTTAGTTTSGTLRCDVRDRAVECAPHRIFTATASTPPRWMRVTPPSPQAAKRRSKRKTKGRSKRKTKNKSNAKANSTIEDASAAEDARAIALQRAPKKRRYRPPMPSPLPSLGLASLGLSQHFLLDSLPILPGSPATSKLAASDPLLPQDLSCVFADEPLQHSALPQFVTIALNGRTSHLEPDHHHHVFDSHESLDGNDDDNDFALFSADELAELELCAALY